MQDELRVGALRKAIDRFSESLAEPQSGISRDSSIKRFELCFELSWKVVQSHLRARGLVCRSPRDCLRETFGYGLLADERLWARMAQDRNLNVHTYNDELADTLFARLPDYLGALRELPAALDADNAPLSGESAP